MIPQLTFFPLAKTQQPGNFLWTIAIWGISGLIFFPATEPLEGWINSGGKTIVKMLVYGFFISFKDHEKYGYPICLVSPFLGRLTLKILILIFKDLWRIQSANFYCNYFSPSLFPASVLRLEVRPPHLKVFLPCGYGGSSRVRPPPRNGIQVVAFGCLVGVFLYSIQFF